MSTPADELRALAAELDALPDQPALLRARRARELVEVAKGVLSRARQEAIYEATRGCSWAEVAEALGVSKVAVNKAITAHLRELRDRQDAATGD
ncbi:hypothetical protein [Saccharopolyspora griseoalba]|uniref:RNA polymerase sigma factor 70 region 4 type 2 domain-containing protein n=1 Tax=Saccharopolyspora griseoalba TaxID=1431848 RepID=A0ABW2LUF6_9PSEU